MLLGIILILVTYKKSNFVKHMLLLDLLIFICNL